MSKLLEININNSLFQKTTDLKQLTIEDAKALHKRGKMILIKRKLIQIKPSLGFEEIDIISNPHEFYSDSYFAFYKSDDRISSFLLELIKHYSLIYEEKYCLKYKEKYTDFYATIRNGKEIAQLLRILHIPLKSATIYNISVKKGIDYFIESGLSPNQVIDLYEYKAFDIV